ncbi:MULTISPECIES: tyrosine-type recombinase/integrase [Streptomyces]|uniref:tyrosine-type recombinase/integrase n=1 Tax=Streptomyces TaxID=1883 RepID=UPI0033BD90F5
MARKPATNPRQKRSRTCGCVLCLADYPGDRTPRRDCTGPWQARYRDLEGKQCGPTFPSYKEAKAHLDKVRTQVREGTYQDPKRGAITVAEWYAIWWPTVKVKAVTTRNRKVSAWNVHVEPKWGRRKLNSITWIQVQDWITNEVKGHATQRKALELLRHMMAAAMRDRRIQVNPTVDIEVSAAPGKHPDDLMPPTHEQCNLIRQHMPDYYRPLVDFAEETGMRWGEYTALRLCNLSLPFGTVKVKEVLTEDNGKLRRKMAPKTAAGFRTVPLTPTAIAAAQVMIHLWEPVATESDIEDGEMHPEELVFRGPQGGLLSRHNFRRNWIPAIQAAGIARKVKNPETGRLEWWPRVHDLRHTFATRLKDAGVPEKDVQVIMGHERGGKVTWLYQHAGPELVEEVRAALVRGRPLRAVS